MLCSDKRIPARITSKPYAAEYKKEETGNGQVCHQAKRFRLFLHTEGGQRLIAVSQSYTTESACRNGIKSVMKNAPAASLEDLTEEGRAAVKHPKFELYEDKAGKSRFRLKASNGQIIAVSEAYAKKASCLSGIESVRKNAADAAIEKAEA